MTGILSPDSKLYRISCDAVVRSRRAFYSSHKETTETITNWLWRTQQCIKDCEFGGLADFLLIDKFICELSGEEMQQFQTVQSFSLAQLYEVASKPQFHTDSCKTESEFDAEQSHPENEILEIELDAVSLAYYVWSNN